MVVESLGDHILGDDTQTTPYVNKVWKRVVRTGWEPQVTRDTEYLVGEKEDNGRGYICRQRTMSYIQSDTHCVPQGPVDLSDFVLKIHRRGTDPRHSPRKSRTDEEERTFV